MRKFRDDDDTPDFSLGKGDEKLVQLLSSWHCVPDTYAWNLAVASYRLGQENECNED